jgi:hypothetical protein
MCCTPSCLQESVVLRYLLCAAGDITIHAIFPCQISTNTLCSAALHVQESVILRCLLPYKHLLRAAFTDSRGYVLMYSYQLMHAVMFAGVCGAALPAVCCG